MNLATCMSATKRFRLRRYGDLCAALRAENVKVLAKRVDRTIRKREGCS